MTCKASCVTIAQLDIHGMNPWNYRGAGEFRSGIFSGGWVFWNFRGAYPLGGL